MTKTKREVGDKRWYRIHEDQPEYPSVTTILQVLAKPALVAWSAKVEREMVMNVSKELYLDAPAAPKMTGAAWLTTLQTRLGTAKAHKKLLEKAGDIGSQIHSLIEWSLKASLMKDAGPSPRICDKAQWAFMAWEDWRKSIDLKPIWVEQTVWSDRNGVAGTMDLFAELSGEVTAKHWLTGEKVTKTLTSTPAILDWKSGKRVYPEAFLQNAAYRSFLREMGHGDPQDGLIVRLPKVEDDPEFEVVWCPPEEECLPVFYHALKLWKWQQKYDTWKPEPKEATKSEDLVGALKESIAQVAAQKSL
jgi:hypothetical protein